MTHRVYSEIRNALRPNACSHYLESELFMRFMKESSVQVSKLLTMVCLLGALPSLAYASASDGGNSGGGGHEIEAGFKTKLLSLFREQQDMSTASKALLKYEPERILARLEIPNAFKPLCARGPTLHRLRDEVKMARVYPETPNVVHLNCTDYSIGQWKDLFGSEEPGDLIFFIHEGLRIANEENEDDYGKSSSFLSASRREEQYAKSVAYELLSESRKNRRCSVEITLDSTFARRDTDKFVVGYVEFYVGNDLVEKRRSIFPNYQYRLRELKTAILSTYRQSEVCPGTRDLLRFARDYACLSEPVVSSAALDPNGVVKAIHTAGSSDRGAPAVTENRDMKPHEAGGTGPSNTGAIATETSATAAR